MLGSVTEMARRADAARRLSRALRRPQRDRGRHALGHYVIALPEDSVGFVSQRVSEVGGTADVVVALGPDLHVFGWSDIAETDTPFYDEIWRQAVDPDAPIGMLLDLVLADPFGSHMIRVEAHRGVQLTDGERLLAPA